MINVSAVITACNDEKIIEESIKSILWVDEIIVVLSKLSTDRTYEIVKKYTPKIFITKNNLGYQRKIGIAKSKYDWILILDSDEVISTNLQQEIINQLKHVSNIIGYYIPYYNYFLNHKMLYGNQNYSKLRLIKKEFLIIEDKKIHPVIKANGLKKKLKHPFFHYSFRSIPQTLKKFSYYASVEAPLFYKKGERVNLKKLTMYPFHMFYAIFFKDQGYKDGIWGFGLAVCFAIYEFLKYWYLLEIQMHLRNRIA